MSLDSSATASRVYVRSDILPTRVPSPQLLVDRSPILLFSFHFHRRFRGQRTARHSFLLFRPLSSSVLPALIISPSFPHHSPSSSSITSLRLSRTDWPSTTYNKGQPESSTATTITTSTTRTVIRATQTMKLVFLLATFLSSPVLLVAAAPVGPNGPCPDVNDTHPSFVPKPPN